MNSHLSKRKVSKATASNSRGSSQSTLGGVRQQSSPTLVPDRDDTLSASTVNADVFDTCKPSGGSSDIACDPRLSTDNTHSRKVPSPPQVDTNSLPGICHAINHTSPSTQVTGEPGAYSGFNHVQVPSTGSRPPIQHHESLESARANHYCLRPQHLSAFRTSQAPRLVDSLSMNHDNAYYLSRNHPPGSYLPPYNMDRSRTVPTSSPLLPSFVFPPMNPSYSSALRSDSVTSLAIKSSTSESQQSIQTEQPMSAASLSSMQETTTLPVFNQEIFNHATFRMDDEFMGWLFNDEQNHLMHSPISYDGADKHQGYSNAPYQDQSIVTNGIQTKLVPDIAPIQSVLDSGQPESKLSVSKEANHKITHMLT